MKVYVHYEGEPDETFKMEVEEDTMAFNILNDFVEKYNAKNNGKLKRTRLRLQDKKKKIFKEGDMLYEISQEGCDYFIQVLEQAPNVLCGNNGCDASFNPEDIKPNECIYHPGTPYFHEGFKQWTCCKKSVDDFEEFLRLPGCTEGTHKPTIPKPKKKAKNELPNFKPLSVTQGGVETYGKKPNTPKAEKPLPPKEAEPEEKPDPLDAKIELGVPCRHNGCLAKFQGDSSRSEKCVYHPGIPIFHEGSKGWSCCKKKTAEFDHFLELEGCTDGRHRFLLSEREKKKQASCRMDWYQNMKSVIMNVYAKKASKTETKITFEPHSISLSVKFDENIFEKVVHLPEEIDPSGSTFEVLTTKVEIVLRKKNEGENWNVNWTI